jgi:excisionase family DNA binding protein
MTEKQPPFTTASLAKRWQCSDQHIRDLIDQGALGAFRLGRLIRIPAAEVARIEGAVEPVHVSATPQNTQTAPHRGTFAVV